MTITFAVQIVRLKVFMTICQTDPHDHSRSQERLKRDYFLTCNISDNTKAITLNRSSHGGRLMDAIYADTRFHDLDLDARSQWVDNGKKTQR